MTTRRVILPLLLSLIGVVLLVGCIPIPATHQFMTNGKPKPSWKIGKGKSNPIQLGHTHIDDAIDFLNAYKRGETDRPLFGRREYRELAPHPIDPRNGWGMVDGHTYATTYHLRTSVLIWPLCGMLTSTSTDGCLLLKTDDARIVIDYEVMSAEEYYEKYRGKILPLPPREMTAPTTLPDFHL